MILYPVSIKRKNPSGKAYAPYYVVSYFGTSHKSTPAKLKIHRSKKQKSSIPFSTLKEAIAYAVKEEFTDNYVIKVTNGKSKVVFVSRRGA